MMSIRPMTQPVSNHLFSDSDEPSFGSTRRWLDDAFLKHPTGSAHSCDALWF